MIIGIAGPVATGRFLDYLDTRSKGIARNLDNAVAPAVTTLALEILKMGHEVVVFTKDSRLTKFNVLKGNRLTIYVAPRNGKLSFIKYPFLSTYFSIRKIFKMYEGHLDVLSVHWTRDYAMAATYFQKKGVPVYITIRDIIPYILKQQRGLNKLGWYIISLKNEWVVRHKGFKFIANSDYTARMASKYWGLNTVVIPNPILDTFLELPIVEKSKDEFRITTISVSPPLDRRKNVLSLLRAFKVLHEEYPTMTLNLIGRGFIEENHEIMQLANDGLLEGVVLCGGISHPDVIKMLQSSHLMMHPSLEETFGNTLLEAMAVGCPVLGGKDSGAVPDVLGNGCAGYLCDVSDVNDIINKIKYIYVHRSEVKEKTAYAKLYCQQKYSSRHVASEYVKLLSQSDI